MAETPAGERFSVIVAPPGSALDAGSRTLLGGAVGGLIGSVGVIFRSSRRDWRVAVTRCDVHGRATGATHRERVADQESATVDRRPSSPRSEAVTGPVHPGRSAHRPALRDSRRRSVWRD